MLRRGKADNFNTPEPFDIEANGSQDDSASSEDKSKSKSKFRPLRTAMLKTQSSPYLKYVAIALVGITLLGFLIFLFPFSLLWGRGSCHIYISGRKGEGKEINGVYELVDEMHNGQPMYQNKYRHHKLNTLHLYFADNGNWHISYDFGADHALAYAHGAGSSNSDEVVIPQHIRVWHVWNGGSYKKDVRVVATCTSSTTREPETLQLIEMEKIVVSLALDLEKSDKRAQKVAADLERTKTELERCEAAVIEEILEEEVPEVENVNPPPVVRTNTASRGKTTNRKNRRKSRGIGVQR